VLKFLPCVAPTLIIFSILLAGITFRLYNLNIENFWIDEMVTFWVTDPLITINDTINRNIESDLHFFFNLILKLYFSITSYEISFGRHLPAALSILSIFSILYLSTILKTKNYIFLLFLISFNIYLIKYAQELRSYSLIFFLTSVSLIFFFKITDKNYKKKKLVTYFFIISQVLIVLTHIYGLIIIFSFIIFDFISYYKFKEKNIYLHISNLITGIISFLFLIIYLKNISHTVDWYPKIELKFFTNFYFSKFFGSRLLGLLHLILLIYLIVKSRIWLLKKYDQRLILILIIIFSYLVPISYSLIIKPILLDKYIIFVLVPVLVLTSNLICLIKNHLFRKIVISLTILLTIGNLFTETAIKQFFSKRIIHKPDLKSTFIEINDSNYKNYSFNLEKGNWTSEKTLNDILKNYSEKYTKQMNLKLNYINYKNNGEMFKNSNSNFLWLVCLYDINGRSCLVPKNFNNVQIIKEKNFNSINLKLLKF
jgi:hypothetical protein